MVSLSAPRPDGPLVLRLAASPRPALVQGPQEPAASSAGAHGTVDQRIELSGAVVVNWAAKAAGLLLQEGVAPGDEVLLDLPDHWLSRALALGVLCAGADLSPASGTSPDDAGPASAGPAAAVVLTDRPEAWTDPALTVMAVRLPRGLAPEEPIAGLDPAVVDVLAEVRAQPDALPGPVDRVTPESVAEGLAEDAVAEDPAAPAPGDAGRARLIASTVRETLAAWDAGRAAAVPA